MICAMPGGCSGSRNMGGHAPPELYLARVGVAGRRQCGAQQLSVSLAQNLSPEAEAGVAWHLRWAQGKEHIGKSW